MWTQTLRFLSTLYFGFSGEREVRGVKTQTSTQLEPRGLWLRALVLQAWNRDESEYTSLITLCEPLASCGLDLGLIECF